MLPRSWSKLLLAMTAGLAVPALGLPACSAEDDVKPPKGIMLAFRTDMSIPEDVASLHLYVLKNGVPSFQGDYFLGPSPSLTPLPGTFALLPPDDPKLPVKVRVVARTKSGKASIMREVITTVPTDRLVLLPLSLQWLCWDSVKETPVDETHSNFDNSTCKSDETCIAGGCEPQVVDSKTLKPYDPKSVFGGAIAPGAKGKCFDTTQCFTGGVGETPDQNCTLAAPPAGKEADYNVALALPPGGGAGICGSESCLIPLERDDDDGWKLENGRVKLPPAVCQKLGTSIVAVATSTSCATKTSAIPTCGPWSSVTSAPGDFDSGGPELDGATLNDGATDGGTDGNPDVSQDSPTDGTNDVDKDAPKDNDVIKDGGSDVQDATFENPPLEPKLGQACASDADCGSIKCLTVSSTALNGEGPPGGVCTLPCGGFPSNYCSLVEVGAACVSFGPPGAGAEYCMKGCAAGFPTDGGFDPNKCFGRPDMGCTFLGSVGASVCLPTCGGTQHCDIQNSTNPQCDLATGLCGKVASQGAPYGSSCGPTDAGVPPPDSGIDAAADASVGTLCAGVCTPIPDPLTTQPGTFVCGGGCVINPTQGCGWLGVGPAQAACVKHNSPPSAKDIGDLGLCTQLCDCQNPCLDPNMACEPINDFALQTLWGRDGYCTYKILPDGGPALGLGC